LPVRRDTVWLRGRQKKKAPPKGCPAIFQDAVKQIGRKEL